MPERPFFDPTRIRRPAQPGDAAPPDTGTLSVRQVTELIRGAIARHLPPTLHVLGEISNFSRPASGHVYFTLKDPTSELRCVMWRSAAARLKFEPEDGLEVIATGGLEVYAQRGTYQLVVRRLEPCGVGALELAFRQLRERLEREGLFDPRRKKPLPRIPERVALVTSPTGAAIRDILQTLALRFPLLDILVFPVRVQGDGAADEIAAAIRALNQHADALGGIDVMIVGRGGGSLEDLWAFNEEVVARAIAASRIPTVSAVGHEVDISISDLVADVRAATPTAAAELIAPTAAELLAALTQTATRATRTLSHQLTVARAELDSLTSTTSLARPLTALRQRGQLLDEFQHRLQIALAAAARRQRQRFTAIELALLRFGTGARFARAAAALAQREHAAWRALRERAFIAERRFSRCQARADKLNPATRLARGGDHLAQIAGRIRTVVRTTLAHHRQLLQARLQAISTCAPQKLLQRGYSITRDARTRQIIRSINAIRGGTRIVTEIADGEFRSTADDPRQPRLFE